MDKLTAIKIKYDDGTYSDQIPISVLAENVEWNNTYSLVDILGSIAFDTKGSVQDQLTQLFNQKLDSTDLSNYVNSTLKSEVTGWLNQNVNPVGSAVVVDSSLTISGAAADAKVAGDELTALKADLSEVTEATRNLNTSNMGRWGNAADGKIYARDDKYYGMETFIPVSEGEQYYVSFGGITSPSTISWSYLFTDSNGSTVQRAGYPSLASKVITTPSGAANLNVFCRSDNVITVSDNAYIQIEKGTKTTTYIPPVSASDYIVREIVEECFQIYSFIDSTTDLDVLQKNGAYRWNSTSIPQNSPVENTACRLINVRSDTNSGAGWVQVAISTNVAMFMRYRTSSSWSGWVELASKTYVDDKFNTITINSGDIWEV